MTEKQTKNIKKILIRTGVILATVILFLLITLYSVLLILTKGPSPTAKRLFVLSVKETSAGGFLADICLSKDEIDLILSGDGNDVSNEEMDMSLIKLPGNNGDTGIPGGNSSNQGNNGGNDSSDGPGENNGGETVDPSDGIEVVDVVGSTYNGKMLIISDPSRVFVGVPDAYGEGCYGLSVKAMIEKYGAVAGTNAGGFHDPNGTGTGGIPEGIVIYKGELLWGSAGASYSLAGLDANGILHVGNMTGAEAMNRGIQYAASYGPALVINGKPTGATLGGGLNPRTVIGQRADGAILLLVINGRSIDSLGATLDDLVEIMLSYGAVNASNLDGGSSSIMMKDGEFLTESAYIFGERVVATAILVK